MSFNDPVPAWLESRCGHDSAFTLSYCLFIECSFLHWFIHLFNMNIWPCFSNSSVIIFRLVIKYLNRYYVYQGHHDFSDASPFFSIASIPPHISGMLIFTYWALFRLCQYHVGIAHTCHRLHSRPVPCAQSDARTMPNREWLDWHMRTCVRFAPIP